MKTLIKGHYIDTDNVSFEQTLPVVIRYTKDRENNEVFCKYVYMNNITGEEFEHERDITTEFHRGLDLCYYNVSDTKIDIKYDPISGCLVFFLVGITVYNKDKGTPVPFLEYKRFYVTPNKNIIYYNKKLYEEGEWIYIDKLTKISDLPFNPSDYELLNVNKSLPSGERYITDVVKNVFNLAVNIAGNKSLGLNQIQNIMEFLLYKEPKQRKGPLQEKINKYCEIPIPQYIPDKDVTQSEYLITEGRLLKLDLNMLCIQMFSVVKDRSTYYEAYRIFIEPNGNLVSCKKNNCNEFVPTNKSLTASHWKFAIRHYDENIVEGTKLAYYKNIINDIPVESRGYAVWCFLNYDIFERLYKTGFKKSLNDLFEKAVDNPLYYLSCQFFCEKTKLSSKNIYSAVGLNKYQFTRIMEYAENNDIMFDFYKSIVYYIKMIIAGSCQKIDISHLDNETFDKIFNTIVSIKDSDDEQIINNIKQNYEHLFSVFSKVVNTYGVKTLINNIDNIIQIFISNYYARKMYLDYMNMVKTMNLESDFKIKFTTYEELTNAHNNILIIYKLKKDEYKTKSFMKAVKNCEKYIYSDNNYTIVSPIVPEDIVREGNELHHCVKSYIERVIAGQTNIVFIRKNSDLTAPFFTVEISNRDEIEQIHGLKNRNLKTEPDLEYFVKDWIKKCKLTTTNYNKIR